VEGPHRIVRAGHGPVSDTETREAGGDRGVSPRILLADDEPDIVTPVSYALRADGFDVDAVTDGEQALAAARTGDYDLVILDVMMPKLQGTDVCRQLRAESIVPIIMLTAKDAEIDRVLGLELGADDYVTKPFSVRELASRIRAVLRRRDLERGASAESTLHAGDITVDLASHRVSVAGRDVRLTPSEFKVLALLVREPNRVFSRWQIMEHLWEATYVGTARAADVHVSNLRRKIEERPGKPRRIVTVREAGYKLVPA
jgi:DNA-binding response OmpR family regulator